MGKSVKLTDGSYIDSAGVWDTNIGGTLEQMIRNALYPYIPGERAFTPGLNVLAYDTDNVITLSKGLYIIFTRVVTASTTYVEFYHVDATSKNAVAFTGGSQIPKAPTDGQWRSASVAFPLLVTEDSKSICIGMYSDVAGQSVNYVMSYVKLR